jgi:FAD-dependent urate hydroxylase
MAFPRRMPARDHDMVGVLGPPRGLSHASDRTRSRVRLLRRGVAIRGGRRQRSRPTLLRFAEPVPSLIESIPDQGLHRSTIEEVALDAWVRGRVMLVGDAAHATSPNMAEGAGMALEDALVLADCLKRHEAVPAALSDFEARRRPRTDWVRAQTHRRDRTRYLPSPVRNLALRAFGRRILRSNYRPLREAV